MKVFEGRFLQPGSKSVVMAALDKARPNLPVKPLPKKAAAAEKEEKAVRGTKAAANSKNAVKKVSVGFLFCMFAQLETIF